MNKEEFKAEIIKTCKGKEEGVILRLVDYLPEESINKTILTAITTYSQASTNPEKADQNAKDNASLQKDAHDTLNKTLDYSKKGYYVGVMGCIIGFAGLIVGIYPLVASLLIYYI